MAKRKRYKDFFDDELMTEELWEIANDESIIYEN